METVTCQLMWAGAKGASNYSPTCKYSWKMIVLIWTTAILIKYFDYFWNILWEGGGEVVKGINSFTAENKVVFPGNCSRGLNTKFPPSFCFSSCLWHTPVKLPIISCLPLVPPGSVLVPSAQDPLTCLLEQAEARRGGMRVPGRAPGGSCLRPESAAAWPSVLAVFPVVPISGKPRNKTQLPALTLGFPAASKYRHGVTCMRGTDQEQELQRNRGKCFWLFCSCKKQRWTLLQALQAWWMFHRGAELAGSLGLPYKWGSSGGGRLRKALGHGVAGQSRLPSLELASLQASGHISDELLVTSWTNL